MKVILVDANHTFVIKGTGIFKEMYEMLEQYPNIKIILTNANDEQMKVLGLDKMPYEVFSLKHEPEKTDPEYYRILLKNYNLKAEDCIYFDHLLEVVNSAQSVGIVSYHYDEEKRDLVSLKKFLDANL